MTNLIDGFYISYTNGVVTIEKHVSSEDEFDKCLDRAFELLYFFKRSRPGSDWGCDGIGYHIQKKALHVKIHRSGVGPRNFQKCLDLLNKAHNKVSV